MVVFGQLFKTFSYLDHIKCTRDVGLQEKMAALTMSINH
jgi:hypothetical protein